MGVINGWQHWLASPHCKLTSLATSLQVLAASLQVLVASLQRWLRPLTLFGFPFYFLAICLQLACKSSLQAHKPCRKLARPCRKLATPCRKLATPCRKLASPCCKLAMLAPRLNPDWLQAMSGDLILKSHWCLRQACCKLAVTFKEVLKPNSSFAQLTVKHETSVRT